MTSSGKLVEMTTVTDMKTHFGALPQKAPSAVSVKTAIQKMAKELNDALKNGHSIADLCAAFNKMSETDLKVGTFRSYLKEAAGAKKRKTSPKASAKTAPTTDAAPQEDGNPHGSEPAAALGGDHNQDDNRDQTRETNTEAGDSFPAIPPTPAPEPDGPARGTDAAITLGAGDGDDSDDRSVSVPATDADRALDELMEDLDKDAERDLAATDEEAE